MAQILRHLLRDELTTEIGILTLVFDDKDVLHAVDWIDHEDRLQYLFRQRDKRNKRRSEFRKAKMAAHLKNRFERYFAGEEEDFNGLEVAIDGTPFEESVWRALLSIPRGEIRTYGEMARQIGKPKASRAVGAANGRNPISIVVPCHRVIGSNGTLTGYGGGLSRKEWLLALERSI